MCSFHRLNQMPEHEASMFTIVFIVHRPYFQHPETRDYWTQDMAYEWKNCPHRYSLIHDTLITSVLRAYLMELTTCHKHSSYIHWTIPQFGNSPKGSDMYSGFKFKPTWHSCHGTSS